MADGGNAEKAYRRGAGLATGVALATLLALPAMAQTPPAGLEEVIVTAQKREESANSVPMSIIAATAAQLENVGVEQPRDLARIAPGFTYADSYVGSPIYTLRGVGFSDISLAGRSTVSIYTDQAPIPFAIETRGANLDLQRIEVLKGPQGTLFGQNATGGAINYIAARPTDAFAAGLRGSLGNYGARNAEGYLSGPLTPTLKARLAVQHESRDPWQRSYTTGAENGAVDFTNARLIFDWAPTGQLDVSIALNGWLDKSDVQAGQLIAITPSIPPLAGFVPGLLTYPLAPQTARAADFNPDDDYGRDNSFVQANARIDYRFGGGVTLTSLTSVSKFKQDQLQDIDGTTLDNLNQQTDGDIKSFFEELRLSRDFERGHVVFGLNYATDKVTEVGVLDESDSTVALAFPTPLNTFRDESVQDVTTSAVFVSGDYALTETVTLTAGARYTEVKNDFNGCTSDTGDGVAAAAFGALLFASIPPGGCVTASATFTPTRVFDTLDEDNVSWRVGVDWKPAERMMLYANVGRGYKAGSFPTLAATVASQLTPAVQEAITSYEAGFKVQLAERTLQLNGAVFHSDYEDKQVLGKVLDPFLGPLLRLVNVPKSQIDGAELQAVWAPMSGLTVTGAASYIKSEITDTFVNYDPVGALRNFKGEPFPNTPEWQFAGDVSYTRPITERLNLLLGANMTYTGDTNSQLGQLQRLAVDGYTLVDLRAGIESKSGVWRLTAWGRNVGDTYYWTTGNANLDTTVRFTGMPATYGVTLSLKR